ncbi:unnamed protein product [Adineta ricciae]|nr:unnamed protein product [Adineta ricciae]
MINLTFRILNVGYNIDLIDKSNAWCKVRQYFLLVPAVVSTTISCLATIDQYLATSSSVDLRRHSQIKWAHRITVIMLIFWCAHGIPVFLFYDLSPVTKTCTNMNAAYDIYRLVYLIGIICIIPVSIMILFGCLTYRNVQQRLKCIELHIDQQIIKMTLIHVILVIVSLLPYGIFNIYILITSSVVKDVDRQVKEYLATSILSMMAYMYYVVCNLIPMHFIHCVFHFLGELFHISGIIEALSSTG